MKKNKKIEATKVEQTMANKTNRFLFLLIGFITFFVFANTIGNDYNLDDELVTRNHPLTSQGMKAIGEIFNSPYYKDDMGYAYGYRPIVHVSFAIEHELFGEKASVSHFINVILYVACVLLFLSLLLKWVGEQNKWIAIVAVLFFALHPIHTEVVASIKNRDELLAFLFALLAGLSMIKYIEKEKWISLLWITFYFSLAVLSKKSVYPLTIIFPASSILFYSISWKKLLLILVSFTSFSSIIESELNWSKFLLLLIIPVLLNFLLYYLKYSFFNFSKEINWKLLFKSKILLVILIMMTFVLTFLLKTSFALIFSFPLLILIYFTEKRLSILIFILQLIFLTLVSKNDDYIIVSTV
ncbi:MAG: hypothetical protein EBS86_10445, partial [Crocinitomicaceae bacterium]|nr:hypothetical protein [Crocinitomicaceae bacterium]